MSDHDFDDGLIHSHNWAMLEPTPTADANHPRVADASKIGTPSSTVHDDLMEIGA